ncbi:MAG: hypothetical protein WD355_08655 [Balneolaceae bacterium]
MKLVHDLQKSTVRHCIHKVKSPVSAISGYLELLTNTVSSGQGEQNIERYSKKISDGLHEVSFLLEQLQELYNSDYETADSEFPAVDLNWLAADVADIFNGSSDLNAARVSLDRAEQQIFVQANLIQIKLIIYNLIRATDQATSDQSEIKITTEVVKREAVVHVQANSDSSEPKKVSGENSKKNPFTHNKDKVISTGLEISRRMAEQMDGVIEISTSSGKPSGFLFKAPLSAEL